MRLKDVDMDITANAIYRFYRSLRMREIHFLKTLNRMNDLCGRRKIDGEITLDGENIYDEKWIQPWLP